MRVASWQTALATFTLAMVLIAVITNVLIPPIVTATGGLDPFDITFPLSADDILSGLDRYNAEAQRAYLVFTLVDVVFPISSGLFSSLMYAQLISLSGFPWLISAAKRGLVLLPFVPTLIDLVENVGFHILITSPPIAPSLLASVTAAVHGVKLPAMGVIWATMSCLIVLALAGKTKRWRQRSKTSS
jgi:hypothetical protein